MLKYNNFFASYFFILSIIVLPIIAQGQNCSLTFDGYVHDLGTGLPLEDVNIYVEENGRGAVSDSIGYFKFDDFCKGHYHLVISHIGCEAEFYHLDLTEDTTLEFFMNHSHHLLDGGTVTEKATPKSTQQLETLQQQNISDNAQKSLSNILESIAGVNTLKNGNGIAKPIVHGLYGNRLTILNNEIAISGQQWGNDHSPEIDPLVAQKIKVVKGVGTLQYPGSNLGSVIMIEPQKIGTEPHLHGKANYFLESNGWGNGVHAQIKKHSSFVGWKISGTLKKFGDRKTPNYYLNNTGTQEANLAIQLEKSFSKKLFSELYFSSFNAELGVLRGAHVGNLTDLEFALEQDVPFYTEENFSYGLDAPRQKVNHQLLKLKSKYFLGDNEWLEFIAAGQLNLRKEFDVRRSGRSDIPAMSLKQYTVFLEGKYKNELKKDWKLTTGLQVNFIDNTNNPETGIFPLIPDYLAYETGAFGILTKKINKSLFEFGLRYDNIYQSVVTFSRTTPAEILRYENNFNNFGSTAGWTYSFNSFFNLSYNVGWASRNPAINELYSNGLHQGVSGIEEGDVDLKSERSVKSTLSFNGGVDKIFSFETLLYFQNINDYIFLAPQDEIRLTIRGAFPVFRYEQTQAQIYGFDVSGKIEFTEALHSQIIYSFIKGKDKSHDLPLINLPSNNLSASLSYEFPKAIKIGKRKLENFSLELENKYVFKQKDILLEQDFLAPPDAYYLLGFKMATNIQWNKSRTRFHLALENITNTVYRDYLNRQRYFADDLGFNAALGVSFSF